MKARPTQSRKGVKGGLRPFSSAPCRVKGQRPLWGLGQRPNCSAGDQYAKRAQQRCRQRSVPASNFARPQTRLQAALPPRFREEPFFSCSFTRLTVIILPSDSFSTSACRSVVRPRLPSPRNPVGSRGIFSSPQNKKIPLTLTNQGLIGIRQRLILPGRVQPSTFSTGELNFCVRDGNRWNLSVIATGNCGYFVASTFSFLLFRKRRVEDPRTLTTAHRMIL